MRKFLYVLCQIILIAAFALVTYFLVPDRQITREAKQPEVVAPENSN
jgi:hypothetical protein